MGQEGLSNDDQEMEELGQVTLEEEGKKGIHLLSIIGEVEGHENASGNSKTTKYDHVLPKLAQIEDDDRIGGLLVLLNTSGGDVDAGLAIAEMIASLSIPSVSLVLGGSHSIGVPLAVASDYSFIVPTGTSLLYFFLFLIFLLNLSICEKTNAKFLLIINNFNGIFILYNALD
mgnify:CR=1 FL=1